MCPKSTGLQYKLFQKTCYAFVGVQRHWQDARNYCKKKNADLVKIRSEAENNFITHEVVDWTHPQFLPRDWKFVSFVWTGLNDINNNQTWVWADGSSIQVG